MKKTLITLFLLLPMLASAQMLRSHINTPDDVEGTSEAMHQLNLEQRNWRISPPSQLEFDNLAKRIRKQMEKHPEDRASGYIRLGQMYRWEGNGGQFRDLQVTIDCYHKALNYLTRPQDAPFRNMVKGLLGLTYTTPGSTQDLYAAHAYLLDNYREGFASTSTLANMYLFGWGVPQDAFLATCLFNLSNHNGLSASANQLEFIKMLVEDPTLMDKYQDAYKDYEKASYIFTEGFGTRMLPAAKKGFFLAQYQLGFNFSFERRGSIDEIREVGYRWLKASANAGYAPALYRLAMHCEEHMIDTVTGKKMIPADNGNYTPEQYQRIESQVESLVRRAAAMNYVPAQQELGLRFMNAVRDPNLTVDYFQAQYWLTVCSIYGYTRAKKELQQLEQIMAQRGIKISPEDAILNQQTAIAMVLQDCQSVDNILDAIIYNPSSAQLLPPSQFDKMMEFPDSVLTKMYAAGVQKGLEHEYQTAEVYLVVYQYYERIVKEMAAHPEHYSPNLKRHFQLLLRRIRTRSAFLPYTLITTPSKYE